MIKRLVLPLAASAVLAAPATGQASWCRISAAEQRARADVIFDGIALDNATPTGIQRFRVTRYLKGRGPTVVRVNTGNVRRADGTGSITSVSVIARRGERWRIFGRGSARKVVRTSVCDGSRKR